VGFALLPGLNTMMLCFWFKNLGNHSIVSVFYPNVTIHRSTPALTLHRYTIMHLASHEAFTYSTNPPFNRYNSRESNIMTMRLITNRQAAKSIFSKKEHSRSFID
jgi:hypothetical protein